MTLPLETRADHIAALRARIARIEGIVPAGSAEAVTLDVPEIDRALPWGGLPRGCVHEIAGLGERDAAALGFAAFLLGRFAAGRPVLWIARSHPPYAPALLPFGLAPAQVTLVRARRPTDALWALEEGVRCPDLAGVLAEGIEPDFAASRRLQLAAAESGVTAFLLPPAQGEALASAAITRWHARSVPGAPAPCAGGSLSSQRLSPRGSSSRWALDLIRCRGGRPASWLVDWTSDGPHETHRLALAADPGDRPARPDLRQDAA